MNKKTSFSARLSLNIVLITSILFVVAITVAAVSSHLLIADEAKKSTENLLDATIKDIENTLQRVEFAVMSSSWLVQENEGDDDYLYHITRMIVSENKSIVGSAVAFVAGYSKGRQYFSPYSYEDTLTGSIKSKQLGSDEYDLFAMEWFRKPYETGEACWTEPYYDEGGGECLMCTYCYPIKNPEGDVYAVITADIPLEWLNSITDKIKPYKNSNVALVSQTGTYLNSNSSSKVGPDVFSTLDSMSDYKTNIGDTVEKMMQGKKGWSRFKVGNKVAFSVYGPLSNGWIASISSSYEDVLERTSKLHFILILIGILGLALIFALCYHIIHKMTKPLSEFCSATEDIARGNFNVTLPEIRSEDEIKQLRDSFDVMQKSLGDYMENLKTTTAHNERLESELNIASKIQKHMVPSNFPEDSAVDLYAILEPAREVGGDLYDFFIKDGVLHFAIGDVSGKGVPASMFMAITRSAFRFISGMGLSTSEVMGKINNAVCDGNETAMFVTMFIGQLNLETGELHYCNAGHNPVVLDGSFLPVKPNIAIGLVSDFPYQQQSAKMSRGSRLILYTDGVTEAETEDKQQFGERNLLNSCASDLPAREACRSLLGDVREFARGNDQNDDITIMTIILK